MRSFIIFIVAFLKGFAFGGLLAVVIHGLVALGLLRASITLAVVGAIWRYRVGLAQLLIVTAACLLLRAYHWVMAPVVLVQRITNRSSSFDQARASSCSYLTLTCP